MLHVVHGFLRYMLTAFVLCSMGCDVTDIALETTRRPSDLKQRVLKRFPIGSSLTVAHAVMLSNGFTCERSIKGRFFDYGEGGKEPRMHKDVDILVCKRSEHHLLGWRSWVVAFVYENDSISNVLVQVWSHNLFRDGI